MGKDKVELTVPVVGWAAHGHSSHLAPLSFKRREPGTNDIKFNVKFCGVCHSDLHEISGDWGNKPLPIVPGHEVAGVVTEVGSKVTKFKVGDVVGVGCICDSCMICDLCKEGLEQYCTTKCVWTYADIGFDGNETYGGYSNIMIVRQEFAVKMPDNLPLDAATPLLCAGITVYSPMKYYGMDKGGSFGVVGLGGLGHMAAKIAKAFGLTVTVISHSASKEKECYEFLAADHFVNSKDEAQMKGAAASLDYIIDTVSAQHDLDTYMKLLKTNGKYVVVGLPENDQAILKASTMVYGRKTFGGSLVGGIAETQEMLDFCGKHNVTCAIEKIPITYINEAMVRLAKGDVHYRFVIDIENTLKA